MILYHSHSLDLPWCSPMPFSPRSQNPCRLPIPMFRFSKDLSTVLMFLVLVTMLDNIRAKMVVLTCLSIDELAKNSKIALVTSSPTMSQLFWKKNPLKPSSSVALFGWRLKITFLISLRVTGTMSFSTVSLGSGSMKGLKALNPGYLNVWFWVKKKVL